jgi:hypothetical protein
MTKLREQDLGMVERQNDALWISSLATHENSMKYLKDADLFLTIQNTPTDLAILNKGKSVLLILHEALTQMRKEKSHSILDKAYENYIDLSKKISLYDSTLQELGENLLQNYCHQLQHDVFKIHNWWHWYNVMNRIELKCVEKKLTIPLGVDIIQPPIRTFVIARSTVVDANNLYEAQIGIHCSQEMNEVAMEINTLPYMVYDNQTEISIPYTPLQFDKNGISTPTVNAKISSKSFYRKDTTIYLSTTYTIKRKK